MIDEKDSYGVAPKQRILLSMMEDFHSFCTEHNIVYSIIGGTLLGAIRENGFIPWDDDIDILMDRENFDRLCKLSEGMRGYYLREILWVYKIVDREVFEKTGIQVDTPVLDIFIVDRAPAGRVKKKIKILGLQFLQGMMKTRSNEKKEISVFYKIALAVTGVLGKLFSEKKKQSLYTKLSCWGNKDDSQPLMICNDIFQSIGCVYAPKLIDEFTMVNFEHTRFMAIQKWDNYLTEQYGDYMKPVRTER